MSDRQGATADVKEAPKEFRIFPAGDFMTDDGPHRMTKSDAEALVAIFNARGNVMVIDHDHATTTIESPPENRAAAGWIQKLEVRGEGEVWAVDVVWDPMVEEWLLCKPPKVRYLSPWYSYKMVGDIAIPTRIKNVGLTNNPKTWHCWRLASLAAENKGRKGIGMEQQDLVLAGRTLLALLALMGASNEALATWAKEQNAALNEALGENANAAMQAAGDLEQDDSAAAMSDEDKAKLATALEEEAKKVASMSDEEKAKLAAASQATDDEKTTAASLAAIKNQAMANAADAKARDALITENLAILPKTAIPLLRKASLADVATFVSDMSKIARTPAKTPIAPKGSTTVKPFQKPTGEQKVSEERIASMASKWKIKPKQLDTLRKILNA